MALGARDFISSSPSIGDSVAWNRGCPDQRRSLHHAFLHALPTTSGQGQLPVRGSVARSLRRSASRAAVNSRSLSFSRGDSSTASFLASRSMNQDAARSPGRSFPPICIIIRQGPDRNAASRQ